MNGIDELKIRLDERLRVYGDSPNITATYADLVHVVEDMLKIISNKEIGFSKKEDK